MIILAQNPNGKVFKETKNLNYISNKIRQDKWFQSIVEKEGFEPGIDFQWEWIVNLKSNGSFFVMKEYGNDMILWIYRFENDLKPEDILLSDFQRTQTHYNYFLAILRSQIIRTLSKRIA